MVKRKAQLVFEFVIAALVFFSIVFYTINYLNITVNSFSGDYFTADKQSKALQLSEMFMKNRGVWDNEIPVVAGFSLDWPVLNWSRIVEFDNYCETNYADLLDKFGMNRVISDTLTTSLKFNLTVENASGTQLISCGRNVPNLARARVDRVGILNNPTRDIISVKVWVW